MPKNHLKRIAAPKSWAILRKHRKYITRPKPGRAFDLAMPLNQVMMTLLDKAATTKQARDIIFHQGVEINGKRVYDHRRAVGFLDVITFPSIKESWTISLSPKGRLVGVQLEGKDAEKRLVKIRGKSRVKGKIQLNGRDGSNITVDKDTYKTGDTVVLSKGKVAKHLPLEQGATIMLVGGSHLGEIGTVKDVEGRTIVFEAGEETHSTAKRHAFVIGQKEPEVKLR